MSAEATVVALLAALVVAFLAAAATGALICWWADKCERMFRPGRRR